MDLGLAGRCALITGASMGIGYATAQELLSEGVHIALVARDKARLDANAGLLSNPHGAKIMPLAADMSDADSITRAFENAASGLGAIDILVNNAGSTPSGGLELDDSIWLSSINLKLMGYIRMARLALPLMREHRWGRIINVIGLGAYQSNPQYLAGGAINAALLAATRTLAKIGAQDRVTVNGLNPGPTATPRWDELVAQRARAQNRSIDEERALSLSKLPSGRAGQPEEVAALIAFLASERAAHINGALIGIDGGASTGF